MYLKHMEQTHLGDGFWDFGIVSDLESSSINNNAYNVYLAAQCNNNTPITPHFYPLGGEGVLHQSEGSP